MTEREQNISQNLRLYFEKNNLSGKILIVDDFPADIADLMETSASISYWHTRFHSEHLASPMPAVDQYDCVLIRLPRSHEYFDYVLQMVSQHLKSQGLVYVYGLNDEGIKGAAKKLKEFYGNASPVLIKNHGRIVCSLIGEDVENFTAKVLSDFSSLHTITYNGRSFPLTYYPGMFSHGTLDVGTALLLDSILPTIRHNKSNKQKKEFEILDFACGSGIISAVLSKEIESLQFDLLDNDTLSLEAAKSNVSSHSRIILGDSLKACTDGALYNLIVSNPPIHTDKNLQYETLQSLVKQAPRYLAPDGRLVIVVQARIKIEEEIEKSFDSFDVLRETTRFKVIQCTM